MADNTTLNPGTLGDVIASDDIGGVKFQRVKLVHGADGVNSGDVSVANGLPVEPVAEPVPYWPSYGAPSSTAQRTTGVDEGGALSVRGAVLTDEGTFRVNFANTSLAVSIGTVSVSGKIVTGTGFSVVDVHLKDYFKLDADGESSWAQIASIDSDTQLTLATTYVGGTSGAASRALVQPRTASGATISVASGQATLTSGTTTGASATVGRQLDYAPLVWRSRFSISQRIANQSTRAGLVEFAATPRWFARFRAEGTTNTVIVCESGRNPTTAPSAAETESTTVTLPNGLTTASLNDYRVEMLTENVRFYIAGVLVAEHSKVMPSQYDILGSGVLIENTGTAGSSTNVVIDFITAKNHNKLEVGVMSDAEKVVASTAPVETRTYSQAGVIAINTDLFIVDCAQFRTLGLTCTSMGTSGVVSLFWTNDLTVTGQAAAFSNVAAGLTGRVNTFNAAGTWQIPVQARFARIRLTTATTAGTTSLTLVGFQQSLLDQNQSVNQISNVVSINHNGGLPASTARIGAVAGAGIWYDDSSAALAANATFTGTSRDATVTATATAFANAATYAQEVRVSAESDQTGTLWLEVSRDNTNWRRAKAVPTAAVTGGGFYAEIVHAPSWRYWRCGFTNGATLQTRFTIGSIATAL